MIIIVSPNEKRHTARLLELSPTKATVEYYTPHGLRRRIFRLSDGEAPGGWSLGRETLRPLRAEVERERTEADHDSR